MREFLRELKRRNVFKVAIVYSVIGWVITQVTTSVFPVLLLPEWLTRAVVILVFIGFPIALILAWAYELTPEGIKRTHEVPKEHSITKITGQKLNNILFVVLMMAVLVLSYKVFFVKQTLGTNTPGEKIVMDNSDVQANSIAVLPFIAISSQDKQTYFAEGVAEQILNILAQSTDLKVAARTSSFQFRGKAEDVRNIGKALNVNHVLEGSVRREGNQLRITAQLINTRTGYNEWSRTYHRRLTDIFKVQDEISRSIAGALETKFIPEASEQRTLANSSVKTRVYDEYLQGRYLLNQRSVKSIQEALAHFKKATQLDPEYAPAFAQIAISYTLLTKPTYGNYTPWEVARMAWPYIERAMRLDPEEPDVLIAQGFYFTEIGHTEKALSYFTKAVRKNPSYVDAVLGEAFAYFNLGRYTEAMNAFAAGARIDPLNWVINNNYSRYLILQNRYSEALIIAERFMNLDPAMGHQMMGRIEQTKGHYSNAMKHYLTALSIRPEWQPNSWFINPLLQEAGLNNEVHSNMPVQDGGITTALAGNRQEALTQLQVYLNQYGVDPHAIGTAAIVYLILGQRSQAKQQFDRLWQLNEVHGIGTFKLNMDSGLEYVALLREAGETRKADAYLNVIKQEVRQCKAGTDSIHMIWPSFHLMSAGIKILDGDKKGALNELTENLNQPVLPLTGGFTAGIELVGGLSYIQRAPQFVTLHNDPDYQVIIKKMKERQARIRTQILPVICSWNYPDTGWRPLPETCTGVPDTNPSTSK